MKINELPTRDLVSVLETEKHVLVEFSMTGCEPCDHLGAALASVEETPGLVAFECRYDGRDVMARSAMLRRNVISYPTLLLFRHGTEVGRFTGRMLGATPVDTAERLGPWIAEQLASVEDDAV